MAASTRALTPTLTGPFAGPIRPTTPASAQRNPNGATFGTHLTKSPRGLSPRLSPQPLTGAAALADDRRYRDHASRQTSPNPAAAILQNLTNTAHSTPTDAPQPPARMVSHPDKATKPLVIPELTGVTGENMHTSPVSLSSFGDGESASHAASGDAPAAPTSHDGAHQRSQQHQQHQHQHQLIAPNPNDAPGNRAFTFPGPMPAEMDPRAPTRQMSLPGYGQSNPKSPSTKRHKCPYCSTDFTRHHNLKSHLLTHSQEKPYECPTCQARFRRLHDLKRHTKLHTGERPHTCFKCGRRFARGDALARHNKGQGGCAGRRSSFGIDEEMGEKGEDGMDGIVYTGDHDDEGEEDESGRRISEPARKRQNTGNSTQGSYHQHSSTYPPIAANRGSVGQDSDRPYFGVPTSQTTNVSPKGAPASISSLHNANQPHAYAQGGMTESPKPISPSQQDHYRIGSVDNGMPGSRSPNLSHMQQPPYNRGATRGTPPVALAPPNGPHLPALPGLSAMAPSVGSKSNGSSMLPHQHQHQHQHQHSHSHPHPSMGAPGPRSQGGSMSSHGGSGSSMREVIGNPDVWQYVRDIEARMARMEKEHDAKIATLQTEITTLRAQLAQQQVNNAAKGH